MTAGKDSATNRQQTEAGRQKTRQTATRIRTLVTPGGADTQSQTRARKGKKSNMSAKSTELCILSVRVKGLNMSEQFTLCTVRVLKPRVSLPSFY